MDSMENIKILKILIFSYFHIFVKNMENIKIWKILIFLIFYIFQHFMTQCQSCATAAPTARFFGAQHGAELHWSCADVLRVQNRNLCRRNRKVCCAARRNGENFAANSCVIDANFGKVLRMFDRWMRASSALHAPATRRRNSATSECFGSHAGRSFGALRVDRAENLQRIRAFSGEKFAQSQR